MLFFCLFPVLLSGSHILSQKISAIENNSIQEEIALLRTQVDKLTKQLASYSQYCSIIPQGTCGPCQCKENSRIEAKFYCDCQSLNPKRDCLQFRKDGIKINGLYKVHQNNLRIIQVYCDQTTDGGGWTVFQRRVDGSLKFYRDWETYKKGFGHLQHEFWLGNSNLFTMSLQGLYPSGNELRIDLEDWEGERRYAKYSNFQIGNELTSFQIWVSGYTGNAGDGGHGMSDTNGLKFSTFDKDNDLWPGNCAVNCLGGWWYAACHFVNLNGKYYDFAKMGLRATGIHWYPFHDHDYSLKFVEMKMRRKM